MLLHFSNQSIALTASGGGNAGGILMHPPHHTDFREKGTACAPIGLERSAPLASLRPNEDVAVKSSSEILLRDPMRGLSTTAKLSPSEWSLGVSKIKLSSLLSSECGLRSTAQK